MDEETSLFYYSDQGQSLAERELCVYNTLTRTREGCLAGFFEERGAPTIPQGSNLVHDGLLTIDQQLVTRVFDLMADNEVVLRTLDAGAVTSAEFAITFEDRLFDLRTDFRPKEPVGFFRPQGQSPSSQELLILGRFILNGWFFELTESELTATKLEEFDPLVNRAMAPYPFFQHLEEFAGIVFTRTDSGNRPGCAISLQPRRGDPRLHLFPAEGSQLLGVHSQVANTTAQTTDFTAFASECQTSNFYMVGDTNLTYLSGTRFVREAEAGSTLLIPVLYSTEFEQRRSFSNFGPETAEISGTYYLSDTPLSFETSVPIYGRTSGPVGGGLFEHTLLVVSSTNGPRLTGGALIYHEGKDRAFLPAQPVRDLSPELVFGHFLNSAGFESTLILGSLEAQAVELTLFSEAGQELATQTVVAPENGILVLPFSEALFPGLSGLVHK